MSTILVVPKHKLAYNFYLRRWIPPYSAIYDSAEIETFVLRGADTISTVLNISLAVRSLPKDVQDEDVAVMRYEYTTHALHYLQKLIKDVKDEDALPF